MKEITTFLIIFYSLLVCPFSLKGQQTIYYQQEKIISLPEKKEKQGNHHKEGMFLTFNPKGCYDSDKKGYDVGNGFREIVSTGNNTTLYIGDSYWGNGAIYKVTHDKSRINITIGNKIYVYARSTIPFGINTCCLIKKQIVSNSIGIPSTINHLNNNINDDVKTKSSNDASYYQTRYSQMEQSLISDINTFEQRMAGSYNSSRSSMAMAIRQAQKNMAEWRNFAKQNGVHINASPWESVQIQIGTIHYQKKY